MNMPKIVRPTNLAWMTFWVICGISAIITRDGIATAICGGFAVWNWFRAVREDMRPF